MADPLRRSGRLLLAGPGSALVATVDITPSDLKAVNTAGYSIAQPSPLTVEQPLEANVLALSGGTLKEAVYVVTIDSLYGGCLGAVLAPLLGCARENVLVLASHTHFAPASDPTLTSLGRVNIEYVHEVATKIADAVARSRWHEQVRVRVGNSEVPERLFVNRRRPILGIGIRVKGLGTVVTAPQPTGPLDRTLRYFELLDKCGVVIAVGWGVSCHPVCSPNRQAISSDFPGSVRAHLRQPGQTLPVLFFQGYSGDVRPASMSRRPPLSPRGFARYLLAGFRTFVPQTPTAYESWCSALAASARDARSACGDAVEVDPRLRRVTAKTVSPWEREPQINLVNIGNEIALLTVNAEVMSGRAAELPRAHDASVVIPATCADEVFGYWPTSAMLREGGYEGLRSRPFFPPVGWEQDDPDALWHTMTTQALQRPEGTDSTGKLG